MSTTTRRTVTAVLAACMLLAAAATAVFAQPQGYDEEPYVEGFFYGDFDREVSLFAGGTAEDFCNGDEPTHSARVFNRRDGSVEIKVNNSEQPIYLYSSPLGGPELIAAACTALSDDDPSTMPLEPFAVGEGRVRIRLDIAPDGSVHAVNSTVGTATAQDGTTWKVRGWADLDIVDGVPVGDPAEFQGLRIARTGV